MGNPELTAAQKLLVAVGELVASGTLEFSAEDISVAAHKKFGEEFALKGYPQFPDCNRVYTQIMGKKAPLIIRGWLEKIGTKKYRLTHKGKDDLSNISPDAVYERSSRLARPKEEAFGRLLTSDVYGAFRSGAREAITFHQFCRFAGLSVRDKWQRVQGTLEMLKHVVKEVVELGEAGENLNIHFRKRNYQYSAEDLRLLGAVYEFLIKKFKVDLEGWKRNAFS